MQFTYGIVFGLFLLILRPVVAQPSVSLQGKEIPQLFTPHENPFGFSHIQWGMKWMDYLLKFDCETFPVLSATGEGAALHQDKNVFFLSGSVGGKIQRKVSVPYGSAIFIPILTYFNHYPCPYPGFEPAPGQSMKSFLQQGGANFIDSAIHLQLIIDGHPCDDLKLYRYTTDVFYPQFNPALVCIDMCITTGPQPSVLDGYWVILKPLAKGEHFVYFHAEVPEKGMVVDVGYIIQIE